MSEQFRDVSPEDAELQPIIEGLFAEYAARYGDYFSKDAEVELTEWYLAPQGLFIVLSARARSSPPARISRSTNIPQRSNVSGRIKRCASRGWPLAWYRSWSAGRCWRGYSHIYLTTGFRQPEAVRLYLSQGYQPQFDLNRDPEEYSQPPFDGRLRFTKTLIREALSKTA